MNYTLIIKVINTCCSYQIFVLPLQIEKVVRVPPVNPLGLFALIV